MPRNASTAPPCCVDLSNAAHSRNASPTAAAAGGTRVCRVPFLPVMRAGYSTSSPPPTPAERLLGELAACSRPESGYCCSISHLILANEDHRLGAANDISCPHVASLDACRLPATGPAMRRPTVLLDKDGDTLRFACAACGTIVNLKSLLTPKRSSATVRECRRGPTQSPLSASESHFHATSRPGGGLEPYNREWQDYSGQIPKLGQGK